MTENTIDFASATLFLPDALEAFEKIVRKPPLPNVVYHYTTADGLLGILRSGTIWATNARYMNDASEIIYGRNLVRDVLREEAEGETGHFRTWLEDFVDLVERVHEGHDTYLACFCESGDLLSQWRAYGSGRGFAAGFRGAALANLEPSTLLRVEYDPQVQQGGVRETVRIHLRHLRAAVKEKRGSDVPAISGAFALMLTLWVAALKHPSFAEEREWRLMPLAQIYPVLVRSDRGWLRPYIEIPLAPNDGATPLVSITHGPSPHPELEKRSLTLVLGERYADVAINGSSAPLRV